MGNGGWGAVIVAAGSGKRYGSGIPKQFLNLHGKPVLDWSIETFSGIPEISELVVVTPGEEISWAGFWKPSPGVKTVPGGARRQDSVMAGLRALDSCEWVLVHDGARPLASRDLVLRVMGAANENCSAVPVIPARDTVKQLLPGSSVIQGTLQRKSIGLSQTPQGFRLADLIEALEASPDVTDECEAMERAGHEIMAVPGDPGNIKLTDPGDMKMLESLTVSRLMRRTGVGLDFHPFRKGVPLVVAGCRLSGEMGLEGHSDGDAVLHALADSLLSAARMEDIGVLFPPGEEKWKNADSAVLLEVVADMLRSESWSVEQVDITVISSFPRISPERGRMIGRIAEILGVPSERIWIKGTTTNSLGDIGRGRGLGCMAMTVISRYEEPGLGVKNNT